MTLAWRNIRYPYISVIPYSKTSLSLTPEGLFETTHTSKDTVKNNGRNLDCVMNCANERFLPVKCRVLVLIVGTFWSSKPIPPQPPTPLQPTHPPQTSQLLKHPQTTQTTIPTKQFQNQSQNQVQNQYQNQFFTSSFT